MEVIIMDQYVTGTMIRTQREKHHMTQAQLAEKLNVSFKTVSKWETGKGLPDITLLEPIAEAFQISLSELLAGEEIRNLNRSANLMRSKFYVCPVCGNIIHSTGSAAISCHGIALKPCEAESSDEEHKIFIEKSDNEYYVRIEHEMSKTHYISFIAALSADRLQLAKLYPESEAHARFKMDGVKKIFFYCNRDGLYSLDVVRGIDDIEAGYDHTKEREELEKAAKVLFG